MNVAKVAKRLNLQNGGECLPPLLLMTDDVRLADPLPLLDLLPAGSAVILRHYKSNSRVKLGQALRAATKARNQLLVVAGDVDLALYLGADGLHLPDNRMAGMNQCWQLKIPAHWLVTIAAHSEVSLRHAAIIGADAAILSPVFPTDSHPEQAALGTVKFTALVSTASLPVYALGGISADNVAQIRKSGSVGIAGISGLLA